MKWARIKPSIHSKGQPQTDDEDCFHYYTLDEAKKTFEISKENEWVKHSFEHDFKSRENYERFQKRYETFCGGYLYYYDKIIRSGTVDHVLYFKWKLFNEKGNYFVTIFLSPAPGRLHPSHKADLKGVYHQHTETEKAHAVTAVQKDENGALKMAGVAEPQVMHTEMLVLDNSIDTAIDPPPPPAPPPPPLHEI